MGADFNTPQMAETEVRLLSRRCEGLWNSSRMKQPEGRRSASNLLVQLGAARWQETRNWPPDTQLLQGMAITIRNRSERALQRFAEVDVDSNQQLNFEEFCMLIPRAVRSQYSIDVMRQWFEDADKDGDGTLSSQEYFVWSLANATAKHGANPIAEACKRFDTRSVGTLDFQQFASLCTSMGYTQHALDIFKSLESVGRVANGQVLCNDLESAVLQQGEGASLCQRAKEMLSGLVLSEAESDLSVEAGAALQAQL